MQNGGTVMTEQNPWSKKLPQGYQDALKSIDDFFQHTYDQLQHHPMFLPPIPIRITEENDLWVAEAELPGIDKKQINLDIYRQSIRIQVTQGETTEIIDEQKKTTKRQEQMQVRQRIIQVPFLVQEQFVKATYKNGLLRITIPNNRKQISIE